MFLPSLRFVVFARRPVTPSSHPLPTLPCRYGALQLSGGTLPSGGEGGETCRLSGRVSSVARSGRAPAGGLWTGAISLVSDLHGCPDVSSHAAPPTASATISQMRQQHSPPPPSLASAPLKALLPPTLPRCSSSGSGLTGVISLGWSRVIVEILSPRLR